MKPLTNSQLKKIKEIEEELNVNLDSDNMSYFEAYHIIEGYKKKNSQKSIEDDNQRVKKSISHGTTSGISIQKKYTKEEIESFPDY
jgi:hypothetical protein